MTPLEAVEFLADELHASRIDFVIDDCSGYQHACHELGGETSSRITSRQGTSLVAVGWSGTTIRHICRSTPDCGAKS